MTFREITFNPFVVPFTCIDRCLSYFYHDAIYINCSTK